MTQRFNIRAAIVFLLMLAARAIPAQNELARAEEDMLLVQMLEFLGEFTTENGDWVDPAILADDRVAAAVRNNANARAVPEAGEVREPGREAPPEDDSREQSLRQRAADADDD